MRITVVSTYPPRRCGVGVYTDDLVSHYRRVSPGDEVTVLGANTSGDSVDAVGSGAAADAVNASRPALVLVQYAHGLYGDDAGRVIDTLRRLSAPTVLTVHHVGHPGDPRTAPLPELVAAADAVILLGDEARRRLAEEFGLASADLSVIPHGVDIGPAPGRVESRRVFGIPEDAVVVTTFGLLRPAKGVDIGLRVIAAASKWLPGLVYLVAGTPHPGSSPDEFRQDLRARIAVSGLTDSVLLVDRHLEADELDQVLAAADLQLLPYRRRDQTTSGPLLRGLSAGTPFLATPFTHALELAAHGAGIVDDCEPVDATAARMTRLLDNAAALVSMRDAAWQLAARHDWQRVATLHTDLFRRVTGLTAGAVQ